MPVVIRPLLASDWQAVEAIYAAGIATGDATFETAPPSWEAFDAGRLSDQRLVAVEGEAGPDRVRLEITVRDALASVPEQASPTDPAPDGRRQIPRVVFLQLRGDAQVRGRVDARPVAFPGNAAAETFVPLER